MNPISQSELRISEERKLVPPLEWGVHGKHVPRSNLKTGLCLSPLEKHLRTKTNSAGFPL